MSWRSVLFIWILSPGITPVLAQTLGQSGPAGLTIMQAVDARDIGSDERAEVSMVLEDTGGERRERRLIRLRRTDGPEQQVRIQFQFPPDVRDTAFLLHDHGERDDDRWLYLPTLRKVKRIAGAQKYRNFLGTDFTYDELGGREPEEDTHTLEGEEVLDGRAVYKIRSVPKEDANPYRYRLAWIWKETPIVLQEEYYDRHDRLRKRMRVLDLQPVQGIWTVLKREMVDLQEKHRTELTFSALRYSAGLDSDLFEPRALDRPIP